MCIGPQDRRAAFTDILQIISTMERQQTFSSTIPMFDAAFRQVAEARCWPYSQEDGQAARCIFFFPFSAESAHWQGSIEVLKSTSHYAVFDRFGRFAIYRRSEAQFGGLVLTNSAEEAIAKLEGLSAVDFLSSVAGLREQIQELEEQQRLLELQTEQLYKFQEELRIGMKDRKYSMLLTALNKIQAWRRR